MSDINQVNRFYSICSDRIKKHEFDLKDLGNSIWRGFSAAFAYEDGRIEGGESLSSPTTLKDYDEEFFKVLMRMEPPYRVNDFLTHHSDYFSLVKKGDHELFVKHIKYVILPKVRKTKRLEYIELIENWIQIKDKMNLLEQLQQKNEFLKRAYKLAVETSPSNPLSVSINPIEFGRSIDFDEDTTKRIMVECVSEGLVSSSLGLKMLLMTQKGVNYLRECEFDIQPSNPISVSVGDNSILQFQNNAFNSTQKIRTDSEHINLLETLIRDIKTQMEVIRAHLNPTQVEHLISDIDYLENNLKRPKKDFGILKTVTLNVLNVLKKVPSKVISDLITSYIKNELSK